MSIPPGKTCLLTALLLTTSLGMSGGNGCQPQMMPPDFSPLAGTWAVTRGEVTVKFTFTVNNGGNVDQNVHTATLMPADPADFPEILRPLAQQWNDGLADVNARLDEAIPDSVLISFPGGYQIKIVDAADATKSATGLINKDDVYVFVGDLSGQAQGSEQGGGGVLDVASIEGSFDRSTLTTVGNVVRRLIVVLANSNGSVSFVAEIKVAYTGTRTGDLP